MNTGEIRWYGKTLSPKLTEVTIIVLSDLHYGNPYCSVKHFARTVNFIRETESCYCFLNGDLCETITKNSKGDVFSQIGTPQDQRDWVIEQLLPIRDKVLGVTTGNHEERIYRDTGLDISKDIASSMESPYKKEGMLFKLSFGEGNKRMPNKPYVFWSYITHGYGGARTKSAKSVKVERTSAWVYADWYAVSHDHVVNVAPDIFLMPDNRGTLDNETGFMSGKVTAHRKMLIKTNSFIKWGGYAESGGFPPSDLCTPVIQLLTPKSKLWIQYPEKPNQSVKVVV